MPSPAILRAAAAYVMLPAMDDQSTNRTTNRQTGRPPDDNADDPWLTVDDAATRLGISRDAVRKRIERGRLASQRRGRTTFVRLSSVDTPPDAGRQTDDASALAVALAEIDHLRHELDARTEEIRRRDHIIAGLVERLPALAETAGQEPSPARYAAPGRAETTAPAADAGSGESSFWGRLWRVLMGG